MHQSMAQALAALLLLAVGSVHAGTGRQLLQAPAPAPSTALGPLSTPLYELTATQAISLLCARTVTSVQYVDALLSHYDTGGWSCVNAFIGFNRTKVLEEAAAIDAKAAAGQSITPLCGLPLAVKDTIDVLGYPTSAATPALLGAFPSFEAPLVTTYRDANGIILGKMNLVELSSTVTGINVDANGITNPLNVYNQTRMPGGSSAGSAASVAARFAPWALCEDTGGSCRAPAMAQGIFGLRPTLGCYNFSDSLVPATFTRDTVGSFGRTAEDLILLDSIIRSANATTDAVGASPNNIASCAVKVDTNMSLAGLRIGLPSNFGWVNPGLSAEVQDVINNATAKMTAAGAVLVPFDSQVLNDASAMAWGGGLESYDYEDTDTLARFLYRHNYSISVPEVYYAVNRPDLKALYTAQLLSTDSSRLGSNTNWVHYLQTGRPNITEQWNNTFNKYNVDVFLYPGFATTIPPVDAAEPFIQLTNGSVVPSNTYNFFEIDAQATITALAFPIGFDAQGIPAGLQFAAPHGKDSLMLSLALAMEKLFGPMEPPSPVAGCAGCTVNTSAVPVTYTNTSVQPSANEVWSYFSLQFEGSCNSNFLTDYGRNGMLGMGTNHTQLYNTSKTPVQAAGRR